MDVIRQAGCEFYEVTDGLWFVGKGVSIYVSAEGYSEDLIEHAPMLALAPYGQMLLQQYPALEQWVEGNPMPDEDDLPDIPDTTSLWWKNFGLQLIKCGWHLLWQAELYTTVDDVTSLPHILADFPDEVRRLEWPEDSEVEVNQLKERTCVTTSLEWSHVLSLRA
jgi:hypothetical protein